MSRRKRSYRSVDVKKLGRKRLAESVDGKPLVLSIDVAKGKNYGSFMTEDRKVQVTVRWDLIKETRDIVELVKELPASGIQIAMEPTGTYGDPIRWQFQKEGFRVFQVAAKRSHDAAEVWDGVPSLHDPKCAEIIGRLHLDGVSKEWKERSEAERRMNAALSILEMHEDAYGRRRNQIEAQLARYWPELTRHLDLTGVTILELLSEMGGPAAVCAQSAKATKLMKRVGGSSLADSKIEAVVESAQDSIGIPMIKAEIVALKELAKETRRSQVLKRKMQIQIESLVVKDEEFSRIATVVGKVTAAVFQAQLGSIAGYDNASSVEKAFGLNLKVKSSGKCKGQLKITKRGPSLSRKYLFMAALRLINNDKVTDAWYQAKVRRDGGKQKVKAVVAVMRKIARALLYVAQGKKFDSSKLFNVKLLKV
jgi:transposase